MPEIVAVSDQDLRDLERIWLANRHDLEAGIRYYKACNRLPRACPVCKHPVTLHDLDELNYTHHFCAACGIRWSPDACTEALEILERQLKAEHEAETPRPRGPLELTVLNPPANPPRRRQAEHAIEVRCAATFEFLGRFWTEHGELTTTSLGWQEVLSRGIAAGEWRLNLATSSLLNGGPGTGEARVKVGDDEVARFRLEPPIQQAECVFIVLPFKDKALFRVEVRCRRGARAG